MASPSKKGAKRLKERVKVKLGMDLANAKKKLVNSLLFDFAQQLNKDICWQCGRKIQTVKEMSLEHIVPWSSSEDPAKAYFDLNNIALSHLQCNVRKIRNNPNTRAQTSQDVEIAQDRLARNPVGFRYVREYRYKDFPIRYRAVVPHWVQGKRIKTYGGKLRDTPLEAALEVDEILIRIYGEDAVTNQVLGLLPEFNR